MGGYVAILKHTQDKEDRDTETDSETNTTDTVSDILTTVYPSQTARRVRMVRDWTNVCVVVLHRANGCGCPDCHGQDGCSLNW